MTEAEKLAYIRSAEFGKKVQRALTPKQPPLDVVIPLDTAICEVRQLDGI